MSKLTTEKKIKLEKYANINWQSPESVPYVELGGERLFWLAVRSIRDGIERERTFLANYLNKPKLLDESGEITDEASDWLLSNEWETDVEAVGWFSSKEHPDYSDWYEPFTFDETYILLGWAEYNAPPFFFCD